MRNRSEEHIARPKLERSISAFVHASVPTKPRDGFIARDELFQPLFWRQSVETRCRDEVWREGRLDVLESETVRA